MDSVPYSAKDRLYDALLGSEIPADSCIKQLSLKYTEEIGQDNVKKLTYQLGALRTGCFWSHRPSSNLPCQQIGNYYRYDTHDLMRICAKNLSLGKCCDKFMRRTFGAALFPTLYAKDKQK